MKPLLAAKVGFDELEKLVFPLLASPKLDGIRAVHRNGGLMSRSLKIFPNEYTLKRFSSPKLACMDGELILGSPTAPDVFNQTTRAVMSILGTPDVKFYVFDNFNSDKSPYIERLENIKQVVRNLPHVEIVPQELISTIDELEAVERRFVELGYEGIMIRRPDSPYKYGRSTLKEGYLIKLKRFLDSEAIIIDVAPLMKNENEAEVDNLGHKVRSSKKAGMVQMPMVGALTVKDLKTGVVFEIGSGFTEQQRKSLWAVRKTLSGNVVKYRYQPVGVKEKPRFPTFVGFRSEIDM